MTTITLVNPFSKATVEKDITGIADQEIQGYALDEEICNQVGIFDTPEEWLADYVKIAGSEKAGIEIIGS